MTTKQLSPLSQAVSTDLQAALSATQTKTDSDIYNKHAESDGLTTDTINHVKNFERSFMAGSLDAARHIGLAAHLADPTVEKLELTIGGAKGEEFGVTYTVKKEGTIPASGDKPAKDYTTFGSVRGSHKTISAGRGGDIAIAMALSAEATEAALTQKTKK